MQYTINLISSRLDVLESLIQYHKYCIENNIGVQMNTDNLAEVQEEYDGLKKELAVLNSIYL